MIEQTGGILSMSNCSGSTQAVVTLENITRSFAFLGDAMKNAADSAKVGVGVWKELKKKYGQPEQSPHHGTLFGFTVIMDDTLEPDEVKFCSPRSRTLTTKEAD